MGTVEALELLCFPLREAGGRNQPLRGLRTPTGSGSLVGPAAPVQGSEGSERSSEDEEAQKSSSGHRGRLQLGPDAKPTGGEGADGNVSLCTPLDRSEGMFGKGKGGRFKPGSEIALTQPAARQQRSQPRQVTKTPRQSWRRLGSSVGNADLQTHHH